VDRNLAGSAAKSFMLRGLWHEFVSETTEHYVDALW